jgi:hypothetical protein
LRRLVRPNPTLVHARMLPELARDLERVDTGSLPPCPFVRRAMHRAVVRATQRDSEFVAGLAAERPRLDVPKMMRIRWLAAADEACLLNNVTQMLPVAIPARCSNREDTLVDAVGVIPLDASGLRGFLRPSIWVVEESAITVSGSPCAFPSNSAGSGQRTDLVTGALAIESSPISLFR